MLGGDVIEQTDPEAFKQRTRIPPNELAALSFFIQACYHHLIELSPIELEKARKTFEQCAKEAKRRAAKRAAA